MGILRLSYRQRLIPAAVVCATMVLVYFLWFNAYTVIADAERQPVAQPPSQPQAPSPDSTPSPAPSTSPILLVSAFYPLAKSKHTNDEYRAWLAQFLGHVDSDIYFFTTPELEPLVRAARANLTESPHQLTINTTYASPLAIPPLAPYATKYVQMHAWDRERARHAPDLYAVWNAKPWFLTEGLRNTQRTYKYAFWTDAGSFRHTHTYRTWPDPARVDAVWAHAHARVQAAHPTNTSAADLIFFPIFEVPAWSPALAAWALPAGPVDLDISEGSFFGGAPPALAWYARTFYRYHDYYIATPPPAGPGHPHAPPLGSEHVDGEGPQEYTPGAPLPFHFVGKDQTLINALFMLHPQRFFTVVAPVRAALLPPSALAPPPPSSSLSSPSPDTKTPVPPDAPGALTRLRVTAAVKLWGALRGPAGGVCGDEWFYYQFWLAGRRERGAMRGVWGQAVGWVEGVLRGWGDGEGLEEGEGGAGEGEGGPGAGEERTGCGVMPVVTVEGVLRGVLGGAWEVPVGLP